MIPAFHHIGCCPFLQEMCNYADANRKTLCGTLTHLQKLDVWRARMSWGNSTCSASHSQLESGVGSDHLEINDPDVQRILL